MFRRIEIRTRWTRNSPQRVDTPYFDFMRIPEVREPEFPFFTFSILVFPTFFAYFRRVGRFRFRGFQKVQGLGQTRFMGKILSNEVQQEDFFHNRLRLDLVCP